MKSLLFAFSLCIAIPNLLLADDTATKEKAKPTAISLARGKLTMEAPASWKEKERRSRMLAYEFSATAAAEEGKAKVEADKLPAARVTIMGAGGSIDANIKRWYGQFKQSDGSKTADRAKVEKFEVDGQTVHMVDIPGTFSESMGGGPFAPGKVVVRKDYRMLGAIVVTDGVGQYFIKMTGPSKVCEQLKPGFIKMLRGLEMK